MSNSQSIKEFKELINQMADDSLTDSDKESVFDEFDACLNQQHHNYSEISRIVFEDYDERNEILEYNLVTLRDIAIARGSDHHYTLQKLIDHIQLARIQI